jgi:ribonuclease Z
MSHTPRLKHYLINEKYEDPGIVIELEGLGEYLLFDVGNIYKLDRNLIRKITKVFITHTHLDHFIGFDLLLRNKLGKPHTVEIFGIEPLADNLHCKLQGYIWNLIEFEPQLVFIVKELKGDKFFYYRFDIKKAFKKELIKIEPVKDNIIFENEYFRVRYAVLDHKIDIMGYSFEYKERLKLIPERLKELGLKGKEIGEFKKFLEDENNKGKSIEINGKKYTYEELRERYAYTIPGYKISYITDVIYSEENKKKIVDLVKNSDVLYCESVFLERDEEQSKKVYHLTTRETAEIAKLANVKKLIVFHFSRRYGKKTNLILDEIKKYFPNVE